MANIVNFEPKTRSDLQECESNETNFGPAQLVIFPGVRIERHEFSLADRVNRKQSAAAGYRQLFAAESDKD